MFGDLIIDGVSVSFDWNSCWLDFFVECLVLYGVVVVNVGIFGVCLLSDGMGVSVLVCLDCDVLVQLGVSSMVVMFGINDIVWFGIVFVWNVVLFILEVLIVGYW